MSIQSQLYDRLKDSNGTLYPLVGLRIYPTLRPQDAAFPCVTWQFITVQRDSAMGSDSGITRARVQVDCWSETADESVSVANAVRSRLQRWRDSAAGVPVLDCFILDETHEYDEAAECFRVLLQIELIYDEG